MIIWHLLVSSLSEGAGKYCTDSTDCRPDPGVGAEPGDPRAVPALHMPRARIVFLYPEIHWMPAGFILLVFAHTFTCLSD